MKKTLAILLLIFSSYLIAEETCQHICAANVPTKTMKEAAAAFGDGFELSDKEGRRVSIAFISPSKKECQIKLSNFKPGEEYLYSSLSGGEAFSLTQQVSEAGDDLFVLDLALDGKQEGTTIVKITPLESKIPMKVSIDWDSLR